MVELVEVEVEVDELVDVLVVVVLVGVPDAKIIHDIAASSLFAPLQVLVCVPAVVEVAVEN